MKKVSFLIAILVCLSASLTAQDKKIYQSGTPEVDEHGAIVYDAVDQAGKAVKVVVDPPALNPVNYPWDDPSDPLFKGFEIEEQELFQQKATVNVNVYAVADEEYRAAHSNWQNVLYNIIETADNAYYRDHGINWVIAGYYSWTSNGGNSSAILSDLANDASGLPRGLVQGFTRDSRFDACGIAYVYSSNPGTGFSVCLDQGSSSTTYALRHEIGHNYGCQHDFGSVVCMMNYTYAYTVDYFDNAHKNTVNSHQGWFR